MSIYCLFPEIINFFILFAPLAYFEYRNMFCWMKKNNKKWNFLSHTEYKFSKDVESILWNPNLYISQTLWAGFVLFPWPFL